LSIVKRSPDGREAARYPGTVIRGFDQDFWLLVHATWTYRRIELDGLSFCPEDDILEWFSPAHWFNAFAVFSREGRFKGWYANVTYPAQIDMNADPPVLTWHDLYVDLVGLPDATFTIRDDDELLASGLDDTYPGLYQRILAARMELIRLFAQGQRPFTHESGVGLIRFARERNAPIH
jgi:protein associated with RNAse G/E